MSVVDGFLHPDRLLPADPSLRRIARTLYEDVRELPIISPHGHTDPAWFATNAAFTDAASLLVTPDHYLLRMLHSRGVPYDALGVARLDDVTVADPRAAWRCFAEHYHLFAGTPSSLWLDHAMGAVLGCPERLTAHNADALFDHISTVLAEPAARPRALMDRMGVEVIATTDSALDTLEHHAQLGEQGWQGRVRPTYRPDAVIDPEAPGFAVALDRLGALTGSDTADWSGMIEAHRCRRAAFRALGATATDHGAPSALTADLPLAECQRLLTGARAGTLTPHEAELFRAQMLTEMAGLSVEDGMVMQLHAGSQRNTDRHMLATRGPNMGADIPSRTDWIGGLDSLLNRYGHAAGLRMIVFTLDESAYARELAPMAGYWPCLMLGPPWWFHDSSEGIRRFLEQVVETAGFANLAGFNDDTRALLSIPARHDVWRRGVASFLARLVAEHRLDQEMAAHLAADLSGNAAKRSYLL
ncbi:glucuronate isomerase [Natronohydrobacter thiooxidans]|uniref:glucuronate isomerase n=1 Tax=Natronohydrobacter thiooxidans TaxID=87172 RepID=UPI0008FF4E0A|nr:glucuronate isomerase [Natronohydrobacter thiooxidans]